MNPFVDFEFQDMKDVLNLRSTAINFIDEDICVKSVI